MRLLRFCCLFAWVLSVFHGIRCNLHGFFGFVVFLLVIYDFLMVSGSLRVIVAIYMGFKLFSLSPLLSTWVFWFFIVFAVYLHGFKRFSQNSQHIKS